MTIYDNYNLAGRNTFGMDVGCRRWIDYDSPDDIPLALAQAGPDWLHIGGGSNLLFTRDYSGTVLHSSIKGMRLEGSVLTVGAGERLDDVVAWCCERGLWGLENLSAIPGEIGGAAIQNAGAYGVEIGDSIISVNGYDTITRMHVEIPVDECGYAYRHSMFKDAGSRYIISSLKLRVSTDARPVLSHGSLSVLFGCEDITPLDVRRAIVEIRHAKLPDPAVVGSAGSFFKNPVIDRACYECLSLEYADMPHYDTPEGVKIPAAWLIERAGMKGAAVGGAAVWERQPLVLVNRSGGAKPSDVIGLEHQVISAVETKFGITLKPEVIHV